MKYKIVHNTPSIEDHEIESKKDFQAILNKRNERLLRSRRLRKRGIYTASILGLILIVSGGMLLKYGNHQSKTNRFIAAPSSLAQDDFEDLQLKEEARTSKKMDPVELKKEVRESNNNKTKANSEQKPIEENVTQREINQSNISVLRNRNAFPLIGFDSLQYYLNKEINYPDELLDTDNPPAGSTTVVFTIDTMGKAVNIQIKNSLGPLFDQEAKRLIANMPPWEPAIINGEKRASKLSISLNFEAESHE